MSHTRYEPARARLQRSELAVPGSQPGMFRKALESEADYIFLDLEDAVAPADKVQARLNIIAALHEHDWRERGKTIDRKSTRLNSSHMSRSYAVFCLKKKKKKHKPRRSINKPSAADTPALARSSPH